MADKDRSCSKIAKLGLFTFGHALAASGYGISKLLYHTEYAGMPADFITTLTVTSTNTGGPGTWLHQISTPRSAIRTQELLPGRPSADGFGCLPWKEHINSRQAE